MDGVLFVAERGDERYEIIAAGGGEGVLVFRYVAGRNTHDYFQPDVATGRRCAEELWGLSAWAWRGVPPGERPLWQMSSEEAAD